LRAFYFKITVICRTVGATGTVQTSGEVYVNSGSDTAQVFNRKVADSTVTVDTTTNAALKLTQAWDNDDGIKHFRVKNIVYDRHSTS